MPPRPPLSSSSSFTLLPLSDTRYSLEQQAHPSSNRLMYTQTNEDNRYQAEPTAPSPCDEQHFLQSESTADKEEDAGSAQLYTGYGGAGYHSKPQRGRTCFQLFGTHSDTKESKGVKQPPSFPFIGKDQNVSQDRKKLLLPFSPHCLPSTADDSSDRSMAGCIVHLSTARLHRHCRLHLVDTWPSSATHLWSLAAE